MLDNTTLLNDEIRRREASGWARVSVKEMARRYGDLGYRLDRDSDATSLARYMGGEWDGVQYPACTTSPVESDTGRRAWHHKARRDSNFEDMMLLRHQIFSISLGRILEV